MTGRVGSAGPTWNPGVCSATWNPEMTLITVLCRMADGDTVTLAMACVGLFTHNCRTATSPEPNPRVVSPFTNCMLKVVTSTMAEIPCGNEGMKAGDSVEVETTAAGGSLCGVEERERKS